MPNKLTNIQLSEVSLVDKPANPDAHVLLFKRDDQATTTGNLKSYVEILVKGELKKMADEAKDDKTPDQGLIEQLNATIADLKTQLATANTQVADVTKQLEAAKKPPEPEDIWKGVSPAVKKQFEDMQARVTASEALAKSERDAREMAEFTKSAEKDFDFIPGELTAKASLLKSASQKLSKEESDALMKTLKACNEIIRKSDAFNEIGRSHGDSSSGSAWDRIEVLAKEKVTKGISKSFAEAVEKVAQENQDLYYQYLQERN